MARRGYCGSPEHPISRRGFLGGVAAGATAFASSMTALDVLKQPVLASELKQQGKHVILLWLAGGASQLETWDPKPGRPTGGPFRAISTSVLGIQISELMPRMAQRLKHTAIIHSRNVETITRMGRELDTSLFVHNGPSMACLGLGGEGYLSFSIATPTGEGVTTPLTFTRQRRSTTVKSMRVL